MYASEVPKRLTAHQMDAAADILEERGWLQGDFYEFPQTSKGRVCALGAMDLTGSCNLIWQSMVDALMLELFNTTETNPGKGWSIAAWNDAPHRTADEVVKTFRKVAAGLRDA